jgi:hypothetical protein
VTGTPKRFNICERLLRVLFRTTHWHLSTKAVKGLELCRCHLAHHKAFNKVRWTCILLLTHNIYSSRRHDSCGNSQGLINVSMLVAYRLNTLTFLHLDTLFIETGNKNTQINNKTLEDTDRSANNNKNCIIDSQFVVRVEIKLTDTQMHW